MPARPHALRNGGQNAAGRRSTGSGAGTRPAGSPAPRRREAGAGPVAPSARIDAVLVGAVPPLARTAGALLLVAALAGVATVWPAYLVVDERPLFLAHGVGSTLLTLLVPLVSLAVGGSLAAGRVPKFGLAYAQILAALSVGQLLIELYRGRSSTSRPAVEVLAGEPVLTSAVQVRAGWALGVVALGLVIAAGALAALAWNRTVMEDGGALDSARPALAGGAALLGVLTVLSMTVPAADVPARVVVDQTTGMETIVASEGPKALLERPDLALLGGLLLAAAVLLCSVVVPSVRPRLAAVGGLLALTVTVLAAGLTGLSDALSSNRLEWTVPGAGLLLAGVGYAGLTALAWRVRRNDPDLAARGDRALDRGQTARRPF